MYSWMLPATRSTLPCTIICLAMPASGHFFFRSTKTLPTAPATGLSLRWPVALAKYPRKPRGDASPRRIRLQAQFLLRAGRLPQEGDAAVGTVPRPEGLPRRRGHPGRAPCGKGPSPRRVRELSQLFGADRQTIARWQVFWQEHFPQTRFWKVARSRLVPAVAIDILPLSLLDAFLGRRRSLPGLGPAAAVSLAEHDHRRPGDCGLPLIPTDPQKTLLDGPGGPGYLGM